MKFREFLNRLDKFLSVIVVSVVVSFVATFVFSFAPLASVSEIKDKALLLASLPIYMLMVEDEEVETKDKEAITVKNLKSGEECSVFLISPERYNSEFSGISPLDRCYLTDYLKSLKLERYRALVFDLDLSPVCKGKNRELVEYYHRCQERLDGFLVELSNSGKRIILFDPYYPSGSPPCEAVKRWKDKMESFQNVEFASPALSETLGQIIFYKVKDRSGNFTLGARAFGVKEGDGAPINYVDLELLPGPSKSSEVAFVGGGYNSHDRFLTLKGRLPGVVVHAMGGLSLLSPMKFVSPEELELTLAFAFLNGFLAFFFTPLWNLYKKYRERSFCLRAPVKLFIAASVFVYTLVFLSFVYWAVMELRVFIIPTSLLLAIWATLYYRYSLALEVEGGSKPFKPPVELPESWAGKFLRILENVASGLERLLLKVDELCLGFVRLLRQSYRDFLKEPWRFALSLTVKIVVVLVSLFSFVRAVVKYLG